MCKRRHLGKQEKVIRSPLQLSSEQCLCDGAVDEVRGCGGHPDLSVRSVSLANANTRSFQQSVVELFV